VLATTYAGTHAQPFILLAIGDLEAKKGAPAALEEAAQLYERVLREFASNKVAADVARQSLERTRKALSFDPLRRAAETGAKLEWAKGETASSETVTPTLEAPTTPVAPSTAAAPAPAAQK
jgi:hypothetical protein